MLGKLLAALVAAIVLFEPVAATSIGRAAQTPIANGDAYDRRERETASRTWLSLAETGDALAQFNLGIMYYRGQGVSPNYTEAASWFRQAAEQGHARAQTYLGLMYVLGWGVPQDSIQACKWWSLAATEGNKQARKNLENITEVMTPAQLTEARKLAREWRANHRAGR